MKLWASPANFVPLSSTKSVRRGKRSWCRESRMLRRTPNRDRESFSRVLVGPRAGEGRPVLEHPSIVTLFDLSPSSRSSDQSR